MFACNGISLSCVVENNANLLHILGGFSDYEIMGLKPKNH